MTTTISEICWDAVVWIDGLTQADADDAVQTVIDRIIAVLRRDPRMPPLTSEAWRLLFADVASRSRAELGELIEDKADIGAIVRAIAKESSNWNSAKPTPILENQPTQKP
jgi:hypothetical protein